MNTFNKIWNFLSYSKFLSKATDMICNSLTKINIIVFCPDNICNHFISKNPIRIRDKQSQ